MHEYSRDQIRDCAKGRRITFVGDSTTRQIFWAAAQRLDHKKAEVEYLDLFVSDNPQRDISFEDNGVRLEFMWDPWLNSTGLFTLLESFRRKLSQADLGILKEYGQDSPALIVLGAPGLFSARHGGTEYFDIFKNSIDGVRRYLNIPLDSSALTPRGYSDLEGQILLAPVPMPYHAKLTLQRRETLTPERLEHMNELLRRLPGPAGSRVIWSYNEMAGNLGSSFDQNGMHVNEGMAERRIDVALNVRCNAGLASQRRGNETTCCVARPPLTKTQALLLLAGTIVIPALLWARRRNPRNPSPYLPTQVTLVASLTLVGCALYCYFTDRTHALAHVERHFDEFVFAAIWAGLFTLSACTLRPTTSTAPPADLWKGLKRSQEEFGFLSRPQSDEWKGLMQTGLLLMHFQKTSEVLSLHKITRLFGACYIFMSTYGHATYFLKTGDFSFRRAATVLFRLNFLSCLLSLMLKSDWPVYYFPRIISFWFLITFITFRVFARVNDNPSLVLAKILVVAVTTTLFLIVPGILEACSTVFRVVGRVAVNAGDVRRQIGVDKFVPFFGMTAAVIAHRISILKANRTSAPSNRVDRLLSAVIFPSQFTALVQPLLVASAFIYAVLFFYKTQVSYGTRDMGSYDRVHPYISCFAAVSYAVVRNSHSKLRNMHMLLPAPLGRIALEVYVLHHHIWLGGDGTGLIRAWPWGRSGWLSHIGWGFETLLLTAALLCLSWMAYDATMRLAASLFGEAGGDPARSAGGAYGNYEFGQATRGADIMPVTEHLEKRSPTWMSGPRARAGLLVLSLWVGNILNM